MTPTDSPPRRADLGSVRTLAVILACGAISIAGCGGVGKDDFVEQANAICGSFSKWATTREDTFREALEDGDSTAAAAILAEYRQRLDRSLDRIAALEAPDGDADREAIDRFLTLGRQQADLLPDLATAVEAGDLGELEALSEEGTKLEERLGRAARAYGLDRCAGN